jgi:hypothetical protein
MSSQRVAKLVDAPALGAGVLSVGDYAVPGGASAHRACGFESCPADHKVGA